MSRPLLCVLVAVVASTVPVQGQVGPALGTAAGLGGAAVTEARRLDAPLWNPALAGINDGGPAQTASILGVDGRVLPGAGAVGAAARLGFLTGQIDDTRAGDLARFVAWGGDTRDASAQVRWIGAQARDIVLTVDSRYSVRSELPPELARALGAEGNGQGSVDGETERSLTSVLSLARGAYLGEYPSLGRVWAGVTGKGWWVHDYARGRFQSDLPGTQVYRETVLGNAGGGGVDIGLAGLVGGRVRYGVSIANVYQKSFAPERSPHTRTVFAAGSGDDLQLRAEVGGEIRLDDPDAEAVARAREIWSRTQFPVVVRAGGAADTRWGTLAGAIRETIREGGLDPEGAEAPRTVSWRDTSSRMRLSYGWGDDRSVLGAALSFGSCARRWTVGARRTGDAELGATLDLALSDWTCRQRGAPR